MKSHLQAQAAGPSEKEVMESKKLGKQMTVATKDIRESQARATAIAKKVGEA